MLWRHPPHPIPLSPVPSAATPNYTQQLPVSFGGKMMRVQQNWSLSPPLSPPPVPPLLYQPVNPPTHTLLRPVRSPLHLKHVPHYIQTGSQRAVMMADFLSTRRAHVKAPGCLWYLAWQIRCCRCGAPKRRLSLTHVHTYQQTWLGHVDRITRWRWQTLAPNNWASGWFYLPAWALKEWNTLMLFMKAVQTQCNRGRETHPSSVPIVTKSQSSSPGSRSNQRPKVKWVCVCVCTFVVFT